MKLPHSKEFLKLLKESDRWTAIRVVTHTNPVLVFWVSPDKGEVIDAKNAHHDNPPDGDRSILSDKTNKGYLRGRAVFIGDTLYIVIYGDDGSDLTKRQFALLRRSYPKILAAIKDKGAPEYRLNRRITVNEILSSF